MFMCRRYLLLAAILLILGGNQPAVADSVLIRADQMEGNWPKGMAFGAIGTARAANDTALSTTVTLNGGEYRVYIRAVNSLSQRATYRITVGDRQILTPAQGRDARIGWIDVGKVEVPAGSVTIRVEDDPKDGQEVFDAIALSSDPLSDRAGRALAYNEYILGEVARMTTPFSPPASAREARRRQQKMRRRLLRAIGLDTFPARTPLKPISTGKIDRGDYFIEKVAFESRPHHVVTGLLYVPKNATVPVPAVIGVIGHWGFGKSSSFPQLRAIGLVKRGYVVLNIDPCYAWERAIPGNSEGSDPYISGGAINGHMAWDVMRAVDYLETRTEVDSKHIGLTGASGGGQQTLYGGAVDERIAAVAPAVYIWAFKDITDHWGYSSDNWVPGVLQNGDMAATLAVIAPRPLLVLSVKADYVNLEGSNSQVEQARGFYQALDSGPRISQFIAEGGHGYDKPMREAMYGFMDRWLKGVGDGSPQPEPQLDPFPEDSKELLVFESGKIPVEGAATVRSIWTDQARALRSELPAHNSALPRILRERVLNLPRPRNPVVRKVDGGLLITTEPGVEIPVVQTGAGARTVVWISERDVVTEAESEVVRALSKNATVFVVEPRCMSMPADRVLANQGAILMGRPSVGMWTYDVLEVVDYLRTQQGSKSISIGATGVAPGLAALMASVLDRRIERVAIDGMFSTFLSVIGKNPIAEIPGILRVTDVDRLVQIAGVSRVELNNTQPSPVATNLQSSSRPLVEFMTSELQ
jgi:hypothetical protein